MADVNRLTGQTLVWAFVLPQCVLLSLNWYSWLLIAGEASDQERSVAMMLGLYAICLLVANLVAATFWLLRQSPVPWYLLLVSLVAHAGYMWAFLFNLNDIIPNSVQPWILQEGKVGQYNIALMMPAAFLSLWLLVRRVGANVAPLRAMLIAVLTVVGVPTVWYLVVALVQPAWAQQIDVVFTVLLSSLLVVVFVAALIHIADRGLYDLLLGEEPKAYYAVAALLGLAMPIAGLLLNREIPFPTDFQDVSVYVMAVVNGLVLLIRRVPSQFQTTLLFVRCAIWPFIAYFFLVFLPFLPLSLFAVLAVGLGFLMLTPLLLGIFQTRVTLRSFADVKTSSSRSTAIVISLVGFLVLPSYFTAQAVFDRHTINRTLDFFYSHDYAQSPAPPTQAELKRSARVLESLRDRKAGVQMPYLALFYNRIVFGEMVLTDTKIEKIYHLVTGEVLPDADLFMSARMRRERLSDPPQTEVVLEDYELKIDDSSKVVLSLKLRNQTSDVHTLYRRELQVPEGVLVTGLKLKIGDQWVDGRLFDRKTALWVFEKITEFRRDPALLHYVSDNTLELRVYPFPAKGVREVQIEFSPHPSLLRELRFVEDKLVADSAVRLLFTDGRVSSDMSEYLIRRIPYLHIVADADLAESNNLGAMANRIRTLAAELDVEDYRVTAARLSSGRTSPLQPIPNSAAELAEAIKAAEAPAGGNFWMEAALKRAHIAEVTSEQNRYPIFVVISEGDWADKASGDVALHAFETLSPDTVTWYSLVGGSLQLHCVARACDPERRPEILLLKHNDRMTAVRGEGTTLVNSSTISDIEVFHPRTERFVQISLAASDGTSANWQRQAETWFDRRKDNLNPAVVEERRAQWLKAAREKQVLLPGTAYIVVEAPSQWEILKRKEQQALKTHSGLEFDDEQETSEPVAWLLIILLMAYITLRDRRPIEAS